VVDRALPSFDIREYHEVTVDADAERVLAIALAVPAASDPIVNVLFRLRGIPRGRITLRELMDHLASGGVATTPHSAVACWDTAGVRIAFALWTDPLSGARTRLASETRVLALSPGTRQRFGLYWSVVGPFSALIRRRWLTQAKRLAESRP
jgi:hypothetical protein